MATFKFSLQTALDLSRSQEQQAQLEFSQAQSQRQIAQETVHELADRLLATLESLQAETESTTGAVLEAYDNYVQRLRQNISHQQQQVAQLAEECQRRWKIALERRRKREVLEKLREKQYKQFRREQQKIEDKRLDEIATTRSRQDETETTAVPTRSAIA